LVKICLTKDIFPFPQVPDVLGSKAGYQVSRDSHGLPLTGNETKIEVYAEYGNIE
jgi:hypothetical protein